MRTLPAASVDCIVTSPPYYSLRDYGVDGQYGLEASPAAYVETMRALFAEARRVLADDGTLWLNLGDSYATQRSSDGTTKRSDKKGAAAAGPVSRPANAKNLLGIPWRTAFALQDDGWILRNEIIWHKPNAMPESVRDRLSNRHEHLFLFAKSPRYAFDLDCIREPHAPSSTYHRDIARARPHDLGKTGPAKNTGGVGSHKRGGRELNAAGANPGDVWSITTRPYPAAHFAVFPIDLPLRCIKAGCRPGGTVLDPFSGSGTTGAAARQLGRRYIGIDLNPAYHDLARERFAQAVFDLDLPA
ncbi:site-specific DNA-methyltransferase [Streptomyces sp. NBC_00198]|nr:site-specific DNA-methyltransferase [Streptomyces sp. NBC_00198]MCX5286270.1 site-specific DNA-methyltransferase [Streptomyces sp. NBC_00198]